MSANIPLDRLLDQAAAIAIEAGAEIMKIYNTPFPVAYKEDNSPLTLADTAAHETICRRLLEIAPGIPVLSEESGAVAPEERRAWGTLWLVDPLDGTKEFIKKNGEFTVNIALIENGIPILGVVHAPARAVTYAAARGMGAVKRTEKAAARIAVRIAPANGPLKVVGSRSHAGKETETLVERLGSVEFVGIGSSLKLCLVAEGAADLYPRLGPTMEWDTAAAHSVLVEAGGVLVDLNNSPLVYNKVDLHNPHFIAASSPAMATRTLKAL